MFIGFASLLAIQCTCQPNFEVPKDQTIDPARRDNSDNPNTLLLTEITDQIIEAAKKENKLFLADQLRKLQKAERTNDKVAYINDVEPGGGRHALHAAVDSFLNCPAIVKALLERGGRPKSVS
jgi:hypothetical protein